MGSASELEYHLLLAKDLKLIESKDHVELAALATEVKRMLTALLQKVKADRRKLIADSFPFNLPFPLAGGRAPARRGAGGARLPPPAMR